MSPFLIYDVPFSDFNLLCPIFLLWDYAPVGIISSWSSRTSTYAGLGLRRTMTR